jgi:thioredoxin
MNNLKLLLSVVFIGCSICLSAQKAEEAVSVVNATVAGASDAAESDSGKVVFLGKADFLNKIYDYKKNPDKWVYEGKLPCIIDFYADWCGPCRKVSPILKELADEYKGKVLVYKIDVDKEKELAAVFDVRSIPAYLFIPADGMPQTGVGSLPREYFVKVINEFLLKK